MPQPTPLNDSLNVSKQRWGLPVAAVMGVFAFALLLAWWKSVFLGITVAIGVPALSMFLVSIDPQIYRLAALSLSQKAIYDPGRKGGR